MTSSAIDASASARSTGGARGSGPPAKRPYRVSPPPLGRGPRPALCGPPPTGPSSTDLSSADLPSADPSPAGCSPAGRSSSIDGLPFPRHLRQLPRQVEALEGQFDRRSPLSGGLRIQPPRDLVVEIRVV